MTDARRPRLLRRVMREHRVLVLPILGLVALNLVVYAGLVYPLARRVSGVADRTQAAETDLAAARLAYTQVSDTLSGKSTASRELDMFYQDVLPRDLPNARRLVFPRVQRLARQSDVMARSASVDVEKDRDDVLSELKVQMELTGSYASLRNLISRIERAQEFVVINSVALRGDGTDTGQLTLLIDMSTFFKGGSQ